MKGNRDMVYGNYNAGAFSEPQYIPPQGYNINTQYQAYGPNVMVPSGNMNYGNMNTNNTYVDEYDQRISKIERQIRNLDARLKKLETGSANLTDDTIIDSNLYMI